MYVITVILSTLTGDEVQVCVRVLFGKATSCIFTANVILDPFPASNTRCWQHKETRID